MLEALEQTGVDNWEGYDDAINLFHDLYEDRGINGSRENEK